MSRIKYYDSTTQTWKYSDLAVQNPLPVGTNVGDMLVWNGTMWIPKTPNRLPDAYQEVEYIESTSGGGQYIDTGIYPTGATKAVWDFVYESDFVAWAGLLGFYEANKHFCITWAGSDGQINYLHGSNHSSAKTFVRNKRYLLSIAPTLADCEDSSYSYSRQAFSNSESIKLFYYVSTGRVEKIYRFYASENDLPLIHLIPCYRKSDNEIGMYDLVTNTFFTNAGTGTFLKGNDVN